MAMTFDGTSKWLNSASTFTPPDPGSVSFWMKPDSVSGGNRIFGYHTNWEIRLSGSTLLHEFYQGSTQPQKAGIVVGTWYFVVCVFKTSATAFRELYVDAIAQGSTATFGSPTASGTLSIGQRNGASSSEAFEGVLDDVRVYNRVLSPEEIETMYAAKGRDGIINGLLHRWRLNEGAPGVSASGTGVVKDEMGSINMTPVSTPTWAESTLHPRRRAR